MLDLDHAPSPESLAHRHRLSQQLQAFQRVRPRVPFFQLAAHRIPTLWALYRGLLKAAPTPNIRDRVSALFRKNRHLTSLKPTKEALLQGYRWLDVFRKANQGDRASQAVLSRYDRMIAFRKEKEHWKEIFRKEAAWQRRLRSRPILTGAFLRPSHSNGPLPRLKPQPEALTMMILKRRLSRDRRLLKVVEMQSLRDDMRRESVFEEQAFETENQLRSGRPIAFERHFSGGLERHWDDQIRAVGQSLQATLDLDHARRHLPYPPEMLRAIAQARRLRFLNKQHEREREKRGEVLRATIKRRNKGPPAHILQRMTPEERAMDKVSRSVSEVGYVGMIKRRLGWKLSKRSEEARMAEIGRPEQRAALDRLADEISKETLRRSRMRRQREEGGISDDESPRDDRP